MYQRKIKLILISIILGVLLISSTFSVQSFDQKSFVEETTTQQNDSGVGDSNHHKVLGEQGTATWCQYCPSMSYWLSQVSGDFVYVALVDDKNTYAAQRIDELGLTGFPTTFFDGGFTKVVGGQSNVNNLQNAYNQCQARTVWDVDIDVSGAWMGGGQIQVSAEITNNEGSTYNGHVHVYVCEIVSRWDDYDGDPYDHAMIGEWGINQNVQVLPGGTETITNTYSGPSDISMSNIELIGSVFRQSNMYTDESDVASPSPPNSDPPETPDTPSGPSSGYLNIEYSFETSTTEQNGDDVKYGWDWDGDDQVDEWTGFYPSGATASISHVFESTGTYDVQVKAMDIFNDDSAFSPTKQVDITIGDPPDDPDTPSGETDGMHATYYYYETQTDDPNLGDQIYYYFDWDDMSNSDWLGPYDSGDTISAQHKWSKPGEFDVRVKAKDLAGSESDWSNALTVTMGNTPPEVPQEPEGPSSGIIGISYTFSTLTSDPEGDDIEYRFDWGDGSFSDWISVPFSSHKWLEPGEYGLRVKARDQWDESEWSGFEMITMDEGSLDVTVSVDPQVAIVGEEIHCSAMVTGGNEPFTYEWDFGDGNISSEQNPTHIYQSIGDFTVSLSVQDAIGAYGSNFSTVSIDLTHPPDIPSVMIEQSSCLVNEPCLFTITASDIDGDDISVMVDWDDGSSSEWIGPKSSGDSFELVHDWDLDGTYQVKVKTKDAFGYESEWSDPVEVTVSWQNAFLLGKITDKVEMQETIECTADSLLFISTSPSFSFSMLSGEQIIMLNDGSGLVTETFILGKFNVGFIGQ